MVKETTQLACQALLEKSDLLRLAAQSDIAPKKKASLGQFFTPSPISGFMASLFHDISGHVRLLDPGCGSGSLTAAFVAEAVARGVSSVHVRAVDADPTVESYVSQTFTACEALAEDHGVQFSEAFANDDFILTGADKSGHLSGADTKYTHIIMNPPYKKIGARSAHRLALSSCGIETVNLYAGFVALGIQQLAEGGELVAIIPRSFCNGPYYQSFREQLFNETAVHRVHIFDSRTHAFSKDAVTQKNIIIHMQKRGHQGNVLVSTSPLSDFRLPVAGKNNVDTSWDRRVVAKNMTQRIAPFSSLVPANDKGRFVHIVATNQDQMVVDRLSGFTCTLSDIGAEVSTGSVVDCQLRDDLRDVLTDESVPLLYPVHLSNGGIEWPKVSRKPNAIGISAKSKPKLWPQGGYFVIARRFSSKEEPRRIVASLYASDLPGDLIGFDNKLNVFHNKKQGLDLNKAMGLFAYLNCTLLDKYYRLFGGHTQVNATDLRYFRYPPVDVLNRMGRQVHSLGIDLGQEQIDAIVNDAVEAMPGRQITM